VGVGCEIQEQVFVPPYLLHELWLACFLLKSVEEFNIRRLGHVHRLDVFPAVRFLSAAMASLICGFFAMSVSPVIALCFLQTPLV